MKLIIEIENRQIEGIQWSLDAIQQNMKIYDKKEVKTPHGYWKYTIEK